MPFYVILPFQTKFVLFLDCNEGTCIDRCLGRGRKGDSLEILKARFVGHYRDSMPIVEHFDKLGSLERVDTNRSVPDIFEEIKKVFSAYQT
jgi:UMP-CMP kinase